MTKGAKKPNTKLGDTLIKSRNKKLGRNFNEQTIGMFTTDIDPKEERKKLYSNTDIGNNLENFLEITSLEQKVFESEKQNVVVITKTSSTVLSKEEKEQKTIDHQKLMEKYKLYWNSLTIPRRPKWNENTTTEELLELEKEVFYHWRKGIAKLEEEQGLLVTPFEKNAEVWKQLWRVAERSDLLVQIVDCRNPLLFRCPDLEKYLKEIDTRKVNLLLVNKADLLTKLQRKKWAKYFESEGVEYRFFSAHKEQVRIEKQKQLQRLIEEGAIDHELVEQEEKKRKEALEAAPETEEDKKIKIYNREEILEEFIKLQPKALGDNRYDNRVVVGLAGYPNVGKSSTINVLYGEKKVAVAATPGKTKYVQTIILDDEIVLLDCPGLVFPTLSTSKADLVCNGLLPIDQLRDFISPVDLICERLSRSYLEEVYRVGIPKPQEHEQQDRPPTANEFLSAYAYMRGFRTVHGAPDQSRAARIILKDFVNGKLLYCHPPPGFDANKFQRKTAIKLLIDQDNNNSGDNQSTTTTTTTTTTTSSTTNHKISHYGSTTADLTVTGRRVDYDFNKDNEAKYTYQDQVTALTKDKSKKKGKKLASKQAQQQSDAYTRTKFNHSVTPEAAKLESMTKKEKEENSLKRLEQIRSLKQQILQQQQQSQSQQNDEGDE